MFHLWFLFLFSQLESSDYVKLQTLTPILREIAENHEQEEITEQANDLLVFILTKTNVLTEKRTREHAKRDGDEKGKQGVNVDTGGSKWIPEEEQGINLGETIIPRSLSKSALR